MIDADRSRPALWHALERHCLKVTVQRSCSSGPTTVIPSERAVLAIFRSPVPGPRSPEAVLAFWHARHNSHRRRSVCNGPPVPAPGRLRSIQRPRAAALATCHQQNRFAGAKAASPFGHQKQIAGLEPKQCRDETDRRPYLRHQSIGCVVLFVWQKPSCGDRGIENERHQ